MTKEPNMTQPEKEFEVVPGAWMKYDGKKVRVIGTMLKPEWVSFQYENHQQDNCRASSLTEWNPDPKPKSFDERIETLACEIGPCGASATPEQRIEWAAELRAIAQDRPAAAVSDDGPWKQAVIEALVVNHIYAVGHEIDPKMALNDLMIYETGIALDPRVSKEAQELIERGRVSAAAVAGSAEPVGYFTRSKGAPYDFLSPLGWAGLHESAQALYRPLYLAPPSPPQPNPVAFDEAAERKLFETAHNGWDKTRSMGAAHEYLRNGLEGRWAAWLASAKFHRSQLNPVGREAWETEYWTLISPDGKRWVEPSALDCVRAEQRERIPASVRLDRLNKFLNDSEPLLHDLVAEVRKELFCMDRFWAQRLTSSEIAKAISDVAAKLGVAE